MKSQAEFVPYNNLEGYKSDYVIRNLQIFQDMRQKLIDIKNGKYDRLGKKAIVWKIDSAHLSEHDRKMLAKAGMKEERLLQALLMRLRSDWKGTEDTQYGLALRDKCRLMSNTETQQISIVSRKYGHLHNVWRRRHPVGRRGV